MRDALKKVSFTLIGYSIVVQLKPPHTAFLRAQDKFVTHQRYLEFYNEVAHFPTRNVNVCTKVCYNDRLVINGLNMNVAEDIKTMLADVLSLGARKFQLDEATPLLGSIPELDSMAVVNVITAMEERFGINVSDDEISADTFATLGSLIGFVEKKLTASPEHLG